MTKMTNVSALNFVLTTFASELPADVAEKLQKMKEQVEKKNSAERKPTATQTANEGFKEAILNAMESGKGYTVTDLLKEVAEISELSNQRVSAIVRQMKDAGLLTREEIKRKAYFTKVEA